MYEKSMPRKEKILFKINVSREIARLFIGGRSHKIPYRTLKSNRWDCD